MVAQFPRLRTVAASLWMGWLESCSTMRYVRNQPLSCRNFLSGPEDPLCYRMWVHCLEFLADVAATWEICRGQSPHRLPRS